MKSITGLFLILGSLSASCVCAGDAAGQAGSSVRGDEAAQEASRRPTGPFFDFPNAYRRGRSAWLRERFREARGRLRGLPAPQEPRITSKLHREPFTRGAWVGRLGEEDRARRSQTESNTIESHVRFFLPGADARQVFLYLAASSYLEELPGEGKIEQEVFLPPPTEPPEGVDSPPPVGHGDWLSRVDWHREGPLAKSTKACYVKTAFEDRHALVIIEQLWTNCGGPECQEIHMSSTQYTVTDRAGGALVHILAFYSGQAVPPLTGGLAESASSEFYLKVLRVVKERAGTWRAPPRVVEFFRRHGVLEEGDGEDEPARRKAQSDGQRGQ